MPPKQRCHLLKCIEKMYVFCSGTWCIALFCARDKILHKYGWCYVNQHEDWGFCNRLCNQSKTLIDLAPFPFQIGDFVSQRYALNVATAQKSFWELLLNDHHQFFSSSSCKTEKEHGLCLTENVKLPTFARFEYKFNDTAGKYRFLGIQVDKVNKLLSPLFKSNFQRLYQKALFV